MKIDELMQLRAAVEDAQEKQEIDAALEEFGETFKKMIDAARQMLIGDPVTKPDMAPAKEAADRIRRIAAAHNMPFPELQTEKELKTYIAEYGREIIFR